MRSVNIITEPHQNVKSDGEENQYLLDISPTEISLYVHKNCNQSYHHLV